MSFEMIDQFANWYVEETVKYMPLVLFWNKRKFHCRLKFKKSEFGEGYRYNFFFNFFERSGSEGNCCGVKKKIRWF